jgi:stage II sporulation protein D
MKPSRGLWGTLLAGLTFAVLPVSPSYAGTVVPVPPTGNMTLDGHGFGHGHGLSQYGAQGAATGAYGGPVLTWQQILAAYYPGTTLAQQKRYVRVLISADTSDDLVVGPRSGLTVTNTATGDAWILPANGAERWRVTASGSTSRVAWLRDGTWRSWMSFTGDGSFFAANQPIRLYYAGTSHRFRGRLISASPTPGQSARDTVNQLSMDQYLFGVVPREMPASWAAGALAAQSVAARSFAAYTIDNGVARHYQLCDTTSCQVYGGNDAETAASNEAVRATTGAVLTYDGEAAFTQFSASSGGWTSENQVSRFPYLSAHADPYDDYPGNGVHNWSLTFDVSKIEKAYPKVGDLKSIEVLHRESGPAGGARVIDLRLVGMKAGLATSVTVSGADFRTRLGLRSTWFSVRPPA